ncbi:glycosyl hydrolase family 1 [Botrytis cinerea]
MGFATASYQIEGAPEEDGRGPSIWDTFCKIPGKIADGSSGDVACDSYHRVSEDIALLKLTGAKAYRFSISWSRIIPLGGRNDPVNEKGIAYYAKLVDDLLKEGITPFVTLFHWDLPDNLDKRYGGLLNKEEFVKDYAHYARVLFKAYPKVKNWITFNEPWCSSILGYSTGLFAPGHTSDRSKSAVGDSSREPWTVGHNILIAHGAAVKIYREEFKAKDGGQIGITLNGDGVYPWDASDPKDVEAAERKLEFSISWFADPSTMANIPIPCAPSSATVSLLSPTTKHKKTEPEEDDFAGNLELLFENKQGDNIGPETQSVWLRPNPQGFHDLILWLSKRYGFPTIYITENGTSLLRENDIPYPDILKDTFRADYFRDYIRAMASAVEKGADVRGYLGWSLMDNFEWAEGYETRFGVTYVDYEGDRDENPRRE